jgi:hypothetical protein
LLGLCACLLGALSIAAARRPLWYDELFSFYVARLPTPGAVLRALLAGADNGPPIDYWLRHLSMKCFGETAWALRLPSILALSCTLTCIWTFARRWASVAAATAAVLLPLGTVAVHYATEGRAYATLLALASLSLLAWQRATENPRSPGRLAVLSLALAAGPLCHYYGVLNYVPIVVGEAVRVFRRRKVSVPILASIAISLSALLLLLPFVPHALEMREHFWASRFGFRTLRDDYRELIRTELLPFVSLCILALLGGAWRGLRRTRSEGCGPREGEIAAAASLALTPVSVWALALLYTNAMTYRYGLVAVLGVALLAGHAVLVLERLDRRLAWAAILVIAAGGLVTVKQTVRSGGYGPLAAGLEEFVIESKARIAVDSPRLFLETFHYLPAAYKPKLVYLTDRDASRRRLGFDNDEIAIPKLKTVVALETEPYSEFCARERGFYVMAAQSRYWLLEQLARDGAAVVQIAQFGKIQVFRVALR